MPERRHGGPRAARAAQIRLLEYLGPATTGYCRRSTRSSAATASVTASTLRSSWRRWIRLRPAERRRVTVAVKTLGSPLALQVLPAIHGIKEEIQEIKEEVDVFLDVLYLYISLALLELSTVKTATFSTIN